MLTAAYIYCGLIFGVIGFQFALIFGAPWGRFTQGGTHNGALPRRGRVMAAVSVIILAAMALAILSAAGRWPEWPRWTGWVAVALNGVVMGLNWATPSAVERNLWGPITSLMFLLALTVMLYR